MSRAKQRENRRLKNHKSKDQNEKPWLNSEGYNEPTAYIALRNIERTQRSPAASR